MLYMADMTAALDAHGLSMEMSAQAVVASIVMSLLAGLTIVRTSSGARWTSGFDPPGVGDVRRLVQRNPFHSSQISGFCPTGCPPLRPPELSGGPGRCGRASHWGTPG